MPKTPAAKWTSQAGHSAAETSGQRLPPLLRAVVARCGPLGNDDSVLEHNVIKVDRGQRDVDLGHTDGLPRERLGRRAPGVHTSTPGLAWSAGARRSRRGA